MRLMKYHEQNMALTLSLYFLAYILITALSIPGATIMTLAGAGIFGFWTSLIIISFASTIGATLSFLGSRYLFRDWVQNKFGEKLQKVNEGMEREGAFYLFSMRLIPIFPFFMINLLMGLTPIKIPTYFFTSQLGMLAGSIIYVNAGVQLSQIESTKDIISPDIIISLMLLGLFPLIVKKLLKR
ncbi:MAG: TVP38/TMEM64 family protein [Deltaproteobacteria bacterium]|nr:MAG: TVP38/TMEM64 family protein [Deltaproteobacteria bacterium]